MRGLMMDWPLTLQHVLQRAERLFPDREVISRMTAGVARTRYGALAIRTRRLASALTRLGVGRGDRVATLMWNTQPHLELYLAVPCMGAVIHTLNMRLSPDQLAFIINHARDRVLVIDDCFGPLWEQIRPRLADPPLLVSVPDGTAAGVEPAYEHLIAGGSESFVWPHVDEDEAAGMCYTSGTTGDPKGVVYSHRSQLLHTLSIGLADGPAFSERDTVLPVVPMFHANAWGMPYACAGFGCRLVLAGPAPQPRDILELLERERVTFASGVPTVWTGVLAELERDPGRYDLSSVRKVLIGGAAVPPSLIARLAKFGLEVMQGWGMTETSPVGTLSLLKPEMLTLPLEDQIRIRAKQGRPAPCVELRIVSEQGAEVPADGRTMGELQIRGPWVVGQYYEDARNAEAFADGWFRTGDVATIDAEGYIQIADRTKDLVKSGGEWISSVELENALMAHPQVVEAVVIAVPDEKWSERPLACVVLKEGAAGTVGEADLRNVLAAKFPRWWVPDRFVFLEAIPKTSVGKFDKKALRERFRTEAT